MTSDDRIADALRAAPLPATPPDLDRRVRRVIRRRRACRVALAVAPVAILAIGLLVWRPRPEPQAIPEPVAVQEIPPEDLAVLFAPPPVDTLTVLAVRNDVSVAALGRMGGVK